MPANITAGVFKIVSSTEGNPPIGVNLTLPAFQPVYLNGPVTTWVIRKDGPSTYRLSVGGYPYTGVMDGKVAASIHAEQNVEWIMTYREYQDAYTISPADDTSLGWTVPNSDGDPRSQIEIQPIISTRSDPPQFLPTQLFRFVPIME